MEPTAEIHHPDTYWVKNKSADNEGTRRRARGGEKNENRERGGMKVDRTDVKQREEEEVSCIRTDLPKGYIKRKRMDEGCGGYRLSV